LDLIADNHHLSFQALLIYTALGWFINFAMRFNMLAA
jgi:hypothetical protein